MKLQSLQDVYVAQLRDLHSAEKQLLKALQKLAHAASSEDLKQCFTAHHAETQQHIQRLEEIFRRSGASSGQRKKCAGIAGIVAEAHSIIDATGDESARDAALIAGAQRAEHYEIACYGTAIAMAAQLQKSEDRELLMQSLEDERRADWQLSALATREINPGAASSAGSKGRAGRDSDGRTHDSKDAAADAADEASNTKGRTTMGYPQNEDNRDRREWQDMHGQGQNLGQGHGSIYGGQGSMHERDRQGRYSEHVENQRDDRGQGMRFGAEYDRGYGTSNRSGYRYEEDRRSRNSSGGRESDQPYRGADNSYEASGRVELEGGGANRQSGFDRGARGGYQQHSEHDHRGQYSSQGQYDTRSEFERQRQPQRSHNMEERTQYSGDRNQYGADRSQYGGDRNQYGSDRSQHGSERSQYRSERNQYGSERNQYGSEHSQQYGGDRNQHGGQIENYRSSPSDSRQGNDERGRYGVGRTEYEDRDFPGGKPKQHDEAGRDSSFEQYRDRTGQPTSGRADGVSYEDRNRSRQDSEQNLHDLDRWEGGQDARAPEQSWRQQGRGMR